MKNSTQPAPVSASVSGGTQSPLLPGRISLVDQVAQWAEQRIAERVFQPGMRMPSVRELSLQRGVSRFTVVEAYERLVARGLLLARPGSGFYVREQAPRRERRAAAPVRSKVIDVGWLARNMLSGIAPERSPGFGSLPASMCGGEMIRLGLRATSAFPLAQLSRGAQAQGYLPLREQLVRKLAEIEVAATPAHVLTTTGCTQSFSLIAEHFLKPGDVVLTGDPAWSAQLGALAMGGVRVVGVPYDAHGPDLKAMAALAAQHKPRMLVINSVLHNPTGTVLSLASAYQILRIAEQHDMLIVEDDVYADFVPDNQAAPRLASLDQLQRVIYLSSFSKMLAPSMRVGYIAANPQFIEDLMLHKLLGSWATPELVERVVLHALTEGSYRRHCQRVRARLDALREPAYQRFEALGFQLLGRPSAGFLGWFDAGVDTNQLAAAGLEAGYLFAPGALFSPTQAPGTLLRINITTSDDASMLKWLMKTLEQLRAPAQ
ncbi:aminotransferase-like domain-containing protein [Roseateles koreensis]|uniref:aminotransferase-like domain-containing protein n=1 Tax=Roseateles koreensis TaxID=2987526 RepID=UPI002359F1F3|nr:PLP-dependent aminotransferase family protein [Roseateles koreensis]